MRNTPDTEWGYFACFLRGAALVALGGAIGLSLLQGCATGGSASQPTTTKQEQRKNIDLAEGPSVFGSGAAGSGQRPVAAEDAAWTVVLAAYRGEGHRAAAEAALTPIQAVNGLEQAFVTTRGPASFVGVGHYAEPSDPKAQAQLQKLRELVVGGQRPFADVFLAPPLTGAIVGSRPEYNLQRARERLGKGEWVTLQIGVYDRLGVANPTSGDLETIRAAAEEAAVQLRREGEQAFYFHGPRRSMVTVGVFPEKEVLKKQLPAAEALRKRHPYNLLNGAGYKANASAKVATSEFVRVP